MYIFDIYHVLVNKDSSKSAYEIDMIQSVKQYKRTQKTERMPWNCLVVNYCFYIYIYIHLYSPFLVDN